MESECRRNVRYDEGTLIAIVPPAGRHRDRAALLAYLKVADGKTFTIESSVLEFFDAHGKLLESREDVFGQQAGITRKGPFSVRFADDSRRHAGADRVNWRVNEMIVEASLSEQVDFRVIYLPLQVPVELDPHIVVNVVNRTSAVLNIADGIRSAICRADGRAYTSHKGGHWDGEAGLNPGSSTTRQFSLDDFPGTPRSGRHEMSIELLGHSSEPVLVDWLPSR